MKLKYFLPLILSLLIIPTLSLGAGTQSDCDTYGGVGICGQLYCCLPADNAVSDGVCVDKYTDSETGICRDGGVDPDCDENPPETTISDPVDWTKDPVTVTLTCTDDNTCATTYYTTDGTTPTTSSTAGNTITLTTDGVYKIKYYSVDAAGNEEAVQVAADHVKIDTTPPTKGNLWASLNWRITGATKQFITLRSVESGSGIKSISALINHQGDNTANKRGYFTWRSDSIFAWPDDQHTCEGGGAVSKHSSHGGGYIDLLDCTGYASSSKTCGELGWTNAASYGSTAVCGDADDAALGGCSGVKTYEQAHDFCTAAGARLCTYGEVNTDEVRGTGCGYDSKRIWTSTPCGVDQYWTQAGTTGKIADFPKECTSKTESNVYVRCCADTTIKNEKTVHLYVQPHTDFGDFGQSNDLFHDISKNTDDWAGNTLGWKNFDKNIVSDGTAPVLDSYAIDGCSFEDTTNKICWTKNGVNTYFTITHTDSHATPTRQYLTFLKDGCGPNGGCNPDWKASPPVHTGDEIKSYVNVNDLPTTAQTSAPYYEWMGNDNVIDIKSAECVGTCPVDAETVTVKWKVQTKSEEGDYLIRSFLYDEAWNGFGYHVLEDWWLNIDNGPPSVSVTGAPDNPSNENQNPAIDCQDDRSGCDTTSYGFKKYNSDPGTCPTTTASYTADDDGTIAISSYKWVCAMAKDNVGNEAFSAPVEFNIDKTTQTITSCAPTAADDNTPEFTCTIDEPAICKLSTVDRSYGQMLADANDIVCSPATHDTSVTCQITNAQTDYQDIYYVSCEDIATNRNGGSNNYEFIYTYSSSAPPEVISHEPADIITSTSTNLQVTTSEDAKCRYSTTADTAYDSMGSLTETSSFSTTPSWPLSDLEEGLHDYYIRCKDILDNKAETDYHISFTVDVSLPSTSYTPPGGWQKTDIEVNLDCTDDNTCAATYYTTDGTTPTEDSSSGNTFTLTTEGTHTIKYYSVDEAGNEEAVQSATIKIDKTAPSIDTGSVTVSPDVWRTEGTSTYDITLTSTEELSGFKQLSAYINEDGDNSVNRRGQIGWHPANPLWEDSDEVDCTGGGVASKHPTSDGADLITITACSTEQTGDVRTVTFTIDPADSFGEFDNNDISMWTKDVATNTRGWNNFNIDFSSDSTPPSIGTCLPPSDAPEFPKIECTVDEPNLGLCGMYTTDTSITSMWPCDNIEGGTSCTAQGDPGDGPEDRSLITYYIKCNDQAGYESTTKAHEYYRDPTPSVEPQVDDDSITPTPGSIIAAEPLSVSFEITKRGRCIALLDPDTSDATSYDLSYTDMLDEDEVDCRTTNTLPPYDLTCNFPTLGAEGEKSVHISCEELEDSPLSSTSGSNKDITYTFDATAPSITATGPSGTFPTDSITLTAETDEQAQCRYSTTSQGYADMTSADSPLSQIHSWTITAAEETNNYFISCSDTINPMTSASPVTFKVDTTPPTIQYTGSTPAHESMVSTDSFTVEAQSTDDNNRYIVGDLDQKLLGWYRFEDADVNTLVDDSTHTTTASNNDALSVPGKFGQALEFPGTSSVSVPDLGSQLVDGFTYQAWVLTYTGNDGEQRGIMSQASSPFLVKRMDGNLGVRLDFTTAGSNWYCNSGTIPINTWSHLAFTWDSSTETLKTYINGVQDCTESTPAGDTLAPIAGNFYIGKTKDDDQYWNGQIDEVQVHKRALSAEEIQSSIDGSTPYSRTYSDLADLHYTFNVFTADEAGHMASETERQVTVDTQGPVIDLTGTPGEFTSAEAVTYSGTATDASSEVVDVQYKLTTTATIQDWTSLSPTPAVEVTFSFDLDPIDTGVYTVFIKAKDGVDQWTEITAPLTVDRTPPTIDTDSVGPSGTVTTSEVTLTVSATDEPVNCRFSTSPSDTTYDDMSNDFETRGVLTNTHQITGLTDLTPETTYYIACQDLSGNDYPDPLSTTFDVNIPEDCDNEVDDDGNGDIDCADTDCIGIGIGPNEKTCCVDNTHCDYDSDCQDFEDGSRECLSVYDIDGNSEKCCISYTECTALVQYKRDNPSTKLCLDNIGYDGQDGDGDDIFTDADCIANNVVTFDTCFDQPGRCDGGCYGLCDHIGKT